MKKLTVCIMAAFLSLTFIPMQLKAGAVTNPTSMPATKPVESAEVNTLLTRLNEINTMDKSTLSSHEKKQLRKEVRSIKSHLKEHDHEGVYISAGAIIIILLLLIILL